MEGIQEKRLKVRVALVGVIQDLLGLDSEPEVKLHCRWEAAYLAERA